MVHLIKLPFIKINKYQFLELNYEDAFKIIDSDFDGVIS